VFVALCLFFLRYLVKVISNKDTVCTYTAIYVLQILISIRTLQDNPS
jgi:hypothetical protein